MKGFVFAASVVLASMGVAMVEVARAEEAVANKPLISLDDFKQVVAAKSATIIDANGTEMYADGHVPGAVSYAAHKSDLASQLPKDKNALVVAYCGGPMCEAWQSPAAEAT